MSGITGILLNWKRPENVTRIVRAWRESNIVTEGIVWNNDATFLYKDDWAKVVNGNTDLGLYTRFAAACLASHRCVLIQDDDLLVPDQSLKDLHNAWVGEPDVLHGIFGRAPKDDGSYARNVMGNAEAPIVLTRVLLADRCYAAEFFLHAPRFEHIQQHGHPRGNGEDILFNYVVQRCSGRLNRTHDVSVKELPAPHAIHGRDWKCHVEHRTKLMHACEAWLEEREQ